MRSLSLATLVLFVGCSSSSEEPPGVGPGASDDDGAAGGACEADLATDPNHCGACGHACLGGECAGGRCSAVALASGLERPRGLALGGGYVYFTAVGIADPERAGVFRVPLEGERGAPEMLAGVAEGVRGVPVDLAIDDRSIYVARRSPNAIEELPLEGGAGSLLWQSASSTTTGSPYAIALDATHVHAALTQGSAVLVSVPKAGGAPRGLATENPHYDSGLFGLAANDTHVFWASQNKVLRIPKGGGVVEPILAEGNGDPRGVLYHEGTLYWTDWGSYEPSDAGSVMACGVDGCAEPRTLASGLMGPLDLVVDGDFLYVTVVGRGQRDGSIVRVPREGGEAEVVASEQATPIAIAVDDKAVYWTNGGYNSGRGIAVSDPAGQGELMMVAK
jgi:hypothetical protein